MLGITWKGDPGVRQYPFCAFDSRSGENLRARSIVLVIVSHDEALLKYRLALVCPQDVALQHMSVLSAKQR